MQLDSDAAAPASQLSSKRTKTKAATATTRDKELDCMIMRAQYDAVGYARAREAALRWGVSTEAEIEECKQIDCPS
jgi:hypothetical protein